MTYDDPSELPEKSQFIFRHNGIIKEKIWWVLNATTGESPFRKVPKQNKWCVMLATGQWESLLNDKQYRLDK